MLKDTFTETINTERLILRKFESSDVESVFKNWASDPEVQLNYGEPVYSSTAEVKALLEKYISVYECANYYRWAVIDGNLEIRARAVPFFLVDIKNEFAEIEYCIGRTYQGKGYATEACKAVIRFGFEAIGLHKVQICCRPKNIKSKSVIEKCGLTYEGPLRDYFKMPDGSFESRMYFSFLRDE